MNGKLKQFCLRAAIAMVLMMALPFQSLAAGARIAFSDPSVQAGADFSVTMKFTSTSGDTLGNTDVMLAYDASAVEFTGGSENASGGSGVIRVTSGMEGKTEIATTLNFRALKAGTTQITVTSWEGYDADGAALTMDRQGSSTITIAAGEQALSADAALKSLQVSPGTLDPAFDPAVENYSTSVSLDTERLTVMAVPNSDTATVAVEGGTELQPGANTVVCRVTAQDGTTVRTYTIQVNKVEGGESIGAGETEGGNTEARADVLVQLDAGRTPMSIGILPLPEGDQVPAGLKVSTITIGDTSVEGWTPEVTDGSQPEYCIFYAIDGDGNVGYYRYDRTDTTIQRYFEYGTDQQENPELLDIAERYNSLVDSYNLVKWIAIGAAAVCVVLLIVLIAVLVSASGSGRGGREQSRAKQQEPEKKPAVSRRSRTPGGRKLTKEERYMMGEEDVYEEEEPEHEPADYLPQTAAARAPEKNPYEPDSSEPDCDISDDEDLEMMDLDQDEDTDAHAEDVEKALAESLARNTAKAADKPEPDEDEDDFEFFDLDDRK